MEISTCEVCGNRDLHRVLDLGSHPLCDDLIPVGNSLQCEEYPIDILFCPVCRTAHQRFQVAKQVLFPQSYHYRARFTADVLNGMKGLVATCEQEFGKLQGKTVLDVGCNDASLLGFFKEKGATTVGIEPTGAAIDAKKGGHRIYNSFFNQEVAAQVVKDVGKPNFITFTNVFAHISNLKDVLDSLRILMAPETILIVENHYLGAVLTGNQFDTFYHEHPRTYSYTSFQHIAASLDLAILNAEFPSRYGGNVRVFIGAPNGKAISLPEVDESDFEAKLVAMGTGVDRWKANKTRALAELAAKHGPLPAKAFPGRAAILLKLLGDGERFISAVYEKPGSMKIGNYVPGTRVPIRDEQELFSGDMSKPVINLAWHIPGEISSYMKAHGYKGPIVNILEQSDFG